MDAVGLIQRHRVAEVGDEQPPLDIPLPPMAARQPPQRQTPASRPSAADDDSGVEITDASALMSMVAEFHAAFGLPARQRPTAPLPAGLAQLRVDLLMEEAEEFAAASRTQDIVGLADALGDIVYVAFGSAVTYGIDLDAVLREIHRSNMSKLDSRGRPLYRSDGKVLKSPQYTPPDVAGILGVQMPLPL